MSLRSSDFQEVPDPQCISTILFHGNGIGNMWQKLAAHRFILKLSSSIYFACRSRGKSLSELDSASWCRARQSIQWYL